FHLRHCPNPLLVQLLSYGHHQLMLTFLVKETAGSIKAERPESSDDMTSWSCSQHQKLWMRTELQDLGLWPGSPPVRNPGNAISLPRVIVGTGGQYYIMSSRLCCKACRRFWFADSPRWLEKLPKRFTNLLPAFLTYKKAICKSVMDELRRTGHSPGDMANQVNELMQLKYERAHLAYLHAIESVREAEAGVYGQRTIGRFVRKENTPRDFGPDGEKDAWCGISVSSYYLTDCLLDEFRRQEPAMSKLLQGTFGQVFRSDHTRKVAQKVTLASGAMSRTSKRYSDAGVEKAGFHWMDSDPELSEGIMYRFGGTLQLNHVPGEGAKVPNWIPVRGTSQQEGYHFHQAKWITGTQVSTELFQAQGMTGVARWNYQRLVDLKQPGVILPAVFDPELVAELNSASNRVTGQEKYPVLHSSHRDTGEKFGL
ncbi:hypothetical protein NHX12_028163, partial [Muraenolepis orangiensis]